MKVLFGAEQLEQCTPKFLIQLAGYLSDKNFDRISIQEVTIKPSEGNELMSRTIIKFGEVDLLEEYELHVHHANDMTCSNWELKRVTKQMPK